MSIQHPLFLPFITTFNVFTLIGLGAFACIGVMNGIRANVSMPLCVLCAVSTGTFGGAVRDVLTKRPGGVRIFNSYADVYATCAGM